MTLHIMNQPKDVDYQQTTAAALVTNKTLAICQGEYLPIARFPIEFTLMKTSGTTAPFHANTFFHADMFSILTR